MRLELSQDEPLTLEFKVFNAPFKFNGIVVWRTHSTVTHPKGIGVKFGPLPRDERRLLRAVIHRLKKIANLYNSARYLMSPEELGQRIEELKSSRLDVARVEEEEAADEL